MMASVNAFQGFGPGQTAQTSWTCARPSTSTAQEEVTAGKESLGLHQPKTNAHARPGSAARRATKPAQLAPTTAPGTGCAWGRNVNARTGTQGMRATWSWRSASAHPTAPGTGNASRRRSSWGAGVIQGLPARHAMLSWPHPSVPTTALGAVNAIRRGACAMLDSTARTAAKLWPLAKPLLNVQETDNASITCVFVIRGSLGTTAAPHV